MNSTQSVIFVSALHKDYTRHALHSPSLSCLMPLQMFIPRSSLSYVFAITGGVFYASKFPENMFPGSTTVALPCDCHMTTRVAACDCHMTTRVAACDCHMTTIGPECDCCVDCFLFSVLSLSAPHPGKVNYFGSSHHWWHVMVLLAFWWTHYTSAYIFRFWRTTSCDQFCHLSTPLVLTT